MVFPANSGCLPQPHRDRHRRAAGDPDKDAFFLGQPARHFDGFFVADQFHAIDHRQIERVGNKSGADALNFVRPGTHAAGRPGAG